MREEIEKLIMERLKENSLDNNDNSSDNEKRKLYIALLKDANKNGFSIPFSEDMSLEELENLARDIVIS